MSIENAVGEAQKARELGIPGILLFGIPSNKNDLATGAFAKDGIIQQAVRRIKKRKCRIFWL